MAKQKTKAGINPEVLAAITAAVAICGYTAESGYQVSSVTKADNPWKRAGLAELMMSVKDFM